jgi:hypothetical protein
MSPLPRFLARPALGGLLAGAALAGCAGSSQPSNGIASKTPAQVVAAAESAAAGAATVHVAGSIVSAGTPISLDMDLVKHKGGSGRLRVDGVNIELIDVDRAVYIRGPRAFYSRFAGQAAARAIAGRWLKASVKSGTLASLASLTDLGKLIDGTLAGHGSLSRAGSTTLGGQKVIGVSDRAGGGTLYVASTGTPYPIELAKGAPDRGTIVFDRWNKPVSLAVPANPLNINQLQSGR